MAREVQSIPASDIQKIADCPLSFNSHYFCVDCSQKVNEGVPCPLCRPFLSIPEDRCNGVSRNYLKDKLEDLHQLFVEKSLNITGEKLFGKRINLQSILKLNGNQLVHDSLIIMIIIIIIIIIIMTI